MVLSKWLWRDLGYELSRMTWIPSGEVHVLMPWSHPPGLRTHNRHQQRKQVSGETIGTASLEDSSWLQQRASQQNTMHPFVTSPEFPVPGFLSTGRGIQLSSFITGIREAEISGLKEIIKGADTSEGYCCVSEKHCTGSSDPWGCISRDTEWGRSFLAPLPIKHPHCKLWMREGNSVSKPREPFAGALCRRAMWCFLWCHCLQPAPTFHMGFCLIMSDLRWPVLRIKGWKI